MAEGGERRPSDQHPFFGPGRGAPYHRQLSEDDIGNQARFLMTRFIHDRLASDGLQDIPEAEQLVEPGTPAGPPVEHVREVATALRKIGDELDNDVGLQELLSRVSPDAPKDTFFSVAKEIFSDGKFNWGRVVALFYFAYKMTMKAILQRTSQLPLLRSIIEWVVTFIIEHVARWIISRGGWEAILEYFGATPLQAGTVFIAGILVSSLFILWQRYR